MGCDIHVNVEVRNSNGIWEFYPISIWEFRNYGVFAFLAGVRNYSAIKPIKEPTYKIPEDSCKEIREYLADDEEYFHSISYLTVQELLAVDYTKVIWDRRVTRQMAAGYWNGGCTTDNPDEGQRKPLSEFLGKQFMNDLKSLVAIGNPEDTRIVFGFDN